MNAARRSLAAPHRGCGGGASLPHIKRQARPRRTRPQAGAGHNIVIRSARGRPRAACAFCITPVMLNRQSRFTLRPANPRPLCLTAGRPAWADRRQAQSTRPIPPTASTPPSPALPLSQPGTRLVTASGVTGVSEGQDVSEATADRVPRQQRRRGACLCKRRDRSGQDASAVSADPVSALCSRAGCVAAWISRSLPMDTCV